MKETVLLDIFLHAGFFFALGSLIIPVMRFLRIPSALGYLLVGIAVGPYGLGVLLDLHPHFGSINLSDTQHIEIIAEISIVLLLFVIGLELTPSRLWQMRNLVFGLGGAQVFVSSIVIGGIAYVWGNNLQSSILFGLSLALSSTAMVLQWIREKSLFTTSAGKTSFSILLFQDLAVIPILFLLTIFSSEYADNMFSFIGIAFLKMIIAIISIYFLGRLALRYIFFFVNRNGGPEAFVAFSLLTIVMSALGAHFAGLSMALGAFMAGILLAETEYRYEVLSFIVPIKSLMLGIFFLSFGMGINLEYITEKPLWIMGSAIGLMFLKASIAFVLCKIWKQSNAASTESAILLSQAGEFGLLVVGSTLSLSLVDNDVGQFMLVTIGLTMIITPFSSILARRLGQSIENLETHKQFSAPSIQEDYNSHIVVFGYGRVGQNIADKLYKEGFSVIGFDKNIEQISAAKTKSPPVFLGDATTQSIIQAANLENALTALITIDNANDTRKIIFLIRKINAHIPIVVRSQTEDLGNSLSQLKNVKVINEDTIISKALSKIVLDQCLPFSGEAVGN